MLCSVTRCISRRFNSQWQQLGRFYEKVPQKLSLVLQNDGDRRPSIRCGVILPPNDSAKSSFVSALVADVYSTNQSWFRTLMSRYDRKNTSRVLIKYGSQFDVRVNSNSTVFVVPSPFLQRHDVEILEFQHGQMPVIEQDRGCHLYVDLAGSSFDLSPSIILHDTTLPEALPFSNTVNSKLALESIVEFIRDKSTVDRYLENIEKSNFDAVSARLGDTLDNRDAIFQDLQRSIIENIKQDEDLVGRRRRIQSEKGQMLQEIEQWSQLAHTELQTIIGPLLDEFIKKQLSLWKIYSYSESRLKLKLVELLIEPLNHLKMKSSLYKLAGKLDIDEAVPLKPPLEIQHIDMKVLAVHEKVSKTIYWNFFSLQLPLILCSSLGVLSEQFSIYSMGSLASLGIALGFKRVLSHWETAMKDVLNDITSSIRENIQMDKRLMLSNCQERFANEESTLDKKLQLIESLSKNLEN